MTSYTTQKSNVRTPLSTTARRGRSLKYHRPSCRETIRKSIQSDQRSCNSIETVVRGPRMLSPREQVLAAYASVYVPKSNHIQGAVLSRLFAMKCIFNPSTRLITFAAHLIQAHWESTASPELRVENIRRQVETARSTHLTSYISTTLARSSVIQLNPVISMYPSFPIVALVLALVFVERLKKLHPNARGQTGCGHRLFLVSYMVASKYLQGHLLTNGNRSSRGTQDTTAMSTGIASVGTEIPNSHVSASVLSSIILPNEQWARLSGVFSTPELTRMELELLAFLQFDLYISYDDFIYHWTKYMDINQLVPNEHFPATNPIGKVEELEDDESVVPDF